MSKKKIIAFTGARSDFWLLKSVYQRLLNEESVEFILVVLASHLSSSHGDTYKKIQEEGFEISEFLTCLLDADTSDGICKTMGVALIELGGILKKYNPDLALIPGDRYEMLSVSSACLLSSVPIAHFYGGDITEGANDNEIRNAITMMASLHFVSNETSQKNVERMLGASQRIYNFGSPALDNILNQQILSKKEIEEELNITLSEKIILATFMPETKNANSDKDLAEFCGALKELQKDHTVIITAPNADEGGGSYLRAYQELEKEYDTIYLLKTLGPQLYASLMTLSKVVLGNSSSGLYEAPSFKVPIVNVGNRQRGRLKAGSVIDVDGVSSEIVKAVKRAEDLNCEGVLNPYGGSDTSAKIVQILCNKEIYESS